MIKLVQIGINAYDAFLSGKEGEESRLGEFRKSTIHDDWLFVPKRGGWSETALMLVARKLKKLNAVKKHIEEEVEQDINNEINIKDFWEFNPIDLLKNMSDEEFDEFLLCEGEPPTKQDLINTLEWIDPYDELTHFYKILTKKLSNF